jgi:hypothetical protein
MGGVEIHPFFKSKIMNIKIPIWALALIAALFLIVTCNSEQKVNFTKKQWKLYKTLLEDSLVQFKDKNGTLSSKVRVMEVINANQILELNSNKQTVIRLQDELKQYKGGVTNSTAFTGQTKFDTIIKTEIKYVYDTLFQDGDTILIPLQKYAVHHNDRWIGVNFDSDSSNTKISIQVENEYSVSLVKNKKKYEAIVKNYNPYSSISEISAVSLQGLPRTKRFGIGLQIGYGINSSFKIQPYLGVGMSYNVVRF